MRLQNPRDTHRHPCHTDCATESIDTAWKLCNQFMTDTLIAYQGVSVIELVRIITVIPLRDFQCMTDHRWDKVGGDFAGGAADQINGRAKSAHGSQLFNGEGIR